MSNVVSWLASSLYTVGYILIITLKVPACPRHVVLSWVSSLVGFSSFVVILFTRSCDIGLSSGVGTT